MALGPVQGPDLRKGQEMGLSVNNGTDNASERSKSNATQKLKTPTAPKTGITCKLIMEYIQRNLGENADN